MPPSMGARGLPDPAFPRPGHLNTRSGWELWCVWSKALSRMGTVMRGPVGDEGLFRCFSLAVTSRAFSSAIFCPAEVKAVATHCGHTNGVSDFALWRWAGSNSKNSSSLPPASPDDVRFFPISRGQRQSRDGFKLNTGEPTQKIHFCLDRRTHFQNICFLTKLMKSKKHM